MISIFNQKMESQSAFMYIKYQITSVLAIITTNKFYVRSNETASLKKLILKKCIGIVIGIIKTKNKKLMSQISLHKK